MDLISRQGAIDGFYEMACDTDRLCTVSDYVHFLETMTSAGPKKGKWIDRSCKLMDCVWECSVCGKEWSMIVDDPKELNMNFCPNCGASMVETEWEN